MPSFHVNDELVEAPDSCLHLSAAEFIRQHTLCKSVKVSCGEGGCGACAVEVVPPGGGPVVAVNSCLLPVSALDGCTVLTSEGLGNSRTGFHEVQARLAAFHGTQCGFCSPGMAVSCHAALMAAAQKASTADGAAAPCKAGNGILGNGQHSSSSRAESSSDISSGSHAHQCNGTAGKMSGSCSNSLGCTGSGAAMESTVAHQSAAAPSSSSSSSAAAAAAASGVGAGGVTAAKLLGALDGNLCRCTGWRPIADMAKSFACDVDIEDLGLNSLTGRHTLGPITSQQLTPAALKHTSRHRKHQTQQQQQQSFERSLQQLQPGCVLAPCSLQQLLEALRAVHAAGLPVHLLAGNTGAGVYHSQWEALSSHVCVLIKGVLELQQITVQQQPAGTAGTAGSSRTNDHALDPNSSDSSQVLVSGAGATISQLLEVLERVQTTATKAAAAAVDGSVSASCTAKQAQGSACVQNLGFMISHIRRIAGTLVRNAATLGGHLALTINLAGAPQQLESDLAPIFVAAGAEVCVTSLEGDSHWILLEELMEQQEEENACGVGGGCVRAAGVGHQHCKHLLLQLRNRRAIITYVRLPLPVGQITAPSSSSSLVSTANECSSKLSDSSSTNSSSSIRFWSHKLTSHRYFNEHAQLNMSVWLSGCESDTISSLVQPETNSSITLRIAIGTYQQPSDKADEARQQHKQQHISTDCQQQQQQQHPVWRCQRARHVEAAVLEVLQQQQQQQCGEPMLLSVLSGLPDLLLQDIQPAGRLADYVRSAAPGLLLKGLAAVLPQQLWQQQHPAAAAAVLPAVTPHMLSELRAAALQELADSSEAALFKGGKQSLPVDMEADPPLYWPTERDGGELQASGEAVYADDVPITAGALHAAYVTSSRPLARLVEVDWSQALEVPGVVGWVGPEDIPAGADALIQTPFIGDHQPLFAHDLVKFQGQALGLILAKTPAAAKAGASRVHVVYAPVALNSSSSGNGSSKSSSSSTAGTADDNQASSPSTANGEVTSSCNSDGRQEAGAAGAVSCDPPSHLPALTTLDSAVAADSWYDLSKLPTAKASAGDVSAALSSASRVLSGTVKIGSQRHFYMEPQTAVATPDEGGRLHVISSCQGCDLVLYSICRALKLRHNQVHVEARRVGGGFGGKAPQAAFHATAAALAAHKYRRQVRLVVPQSVDVSMNAGRCPVEVEWRAGVDDEGRVQALTLDLTLMDGAFGWGMVDALSMKSVADGVYAFPAFSFSLRMARCHVTPRGTVRGPGKVAMAILLELILQHLASALGANPDDFRMNHMVQLPHDALEAATEAAQAAEAAAQSVSQALTTANGHASNGHAEVAGAAAPGLPAAEPSGAAAGAEHEPKQQGNRCHSHSQKQQQQQVLVPHPKYLPSSSSSRLSTALGHTIELQQYTLPYMYQQLQLSAGYAERRAAADSFNAEHSFKKRGLALVPIRYILYRSHHVARVSIYTDGSVLLSHAGVEMGQGIASKAKQAAAHALGQLLPPHQRGGLLPYIRVSGGSTELMPHAALSAGSTTSEAATAAIATACLQLVDRLKPAADKLAAEGQEVTWEDIVKGVCGWEVLTTKVLLTAVSRAGFGAEGPGSMYQSFGAGIAEVEVDCITGERRVLRADLVFDAGRSVTPAVDLGQVEGAFMQGVGYVTTEEVVEDQDTGQNLSSSTWTYKPPGIAELPKELNVSLLHESPYHVPDHKPLSAKATGEPPMMLAAAVSCALQDAVAAAWCGHTQQLQGRQGTPLQQQEHADRTGWPVLQLPATTANIKRALPPLLS